MTNALSLKIIQKEKYSFLNKKAIFAFDFQINKFPLNVMLKKPVLLARIAMISAIVLPFILDNSTIIGMIASLLPTLLLLYSLKLLSDAYQNAAIFRNYAISFALTLLSLALTTVLIQVEVGKIASQFLNMENASFQQIMQTFVEKFKDDKQMAQDLAEFILNKTAILPYFGAIILLTFLQILFYRFSFLALGNSTGINHFKTGSLLVLIGFPTIIILVGGLLILIGWIFTIVGFFTLTDKQVRNDTSRQV